MVNLKFWLLYPKERAPVPIEYEAEWAPEPFRTFWLRGRSGALVKIGALDCAAYSLDTTPTMLFWLPWDRQFFYFHGLRTVLSLGLLIVEVLRAHLDTPQLVELLCTSVCPAAETRMGNVHRICKYCHKWKEHVQ
jgi:hypothetical protein